MNLCKDNVLFRNIFNYWWVSEKKNVYVYLRVNVCDFFIVKIFIYIVILIIFFLFIILNREGIIEEKGSE